MSKQKKDENMEQEKNKKEMEKMTDEKIEQYGQVTLDQKKILEFFYTLGVITFNL